MKQAILKTVMCVGFLMLIAGCKPTVPSRYIQPGELEDILYDYHLADAMASVSGNDSVNMVKYHTAVLQKHGYTEADFDSALVYYLRHTEQLKTIYENLPSVSEMNLWHLVVRQEMLLPMLVLQETRPMCGVRKPHWCLHRRSHSISIASL